MRSIPEAAELIGLTTIERPEDFEANIGRFLAWQRSLPVAESLLELGKPTTGAYSVPPEVQAWFQQSATVAQQIVTVIHESLFSLFGYDRINRWNAGKAYEALLGLLDLTRNIPLAVATTNYDVGAEVGLQAAGRRTDWGEPQHFQDAQPSLAIHGLADGWSAYRTPVLHLHGRVGWYLQEDGSVLSIDPRSIYTATLGQPGLLLPDPDKDYGELPTLNEMWNEFDKLLQGASHTLVMGHSLHDPRLVERLRTARNLAVSVYLPDAGDVDPTEVQRVNDLLPSATVVPMTFGPGLRCQTAGRRAWMEAE